MRFIVIYYKFKIQKNLLTELNLQNLIFPTEKGKAYVNITGPVKDHIV